QIIVYVFMAIFVIGHIVLIFTTIRKVQPRGLWIPIAVQVSIVAMSAVQLFLMINLYAKVDNEDNFSKELCQSSVPVDELNKAAHGDHGVKTWCIVASGLCLLAFALGVAGLITNLLLYFELNKAWTEIDNDRNRLVLERRQNRHTILHEMIRLHERRAAEAANEG
ncbi:hypothetical protein PMAYCL1PPCAC_18809, partial [Pristionchus mayeri]